jgi:hypothetical protein
MYKSDGWDESIFLILYLHSCHWVSKISKNDQNTVSIILVKLTQVHVLALQGCTEVDSYWYSVRFILSCIKTCICQCVISLHKLKYIEQNKAEQWKITYLVICAAIKRIKTGHFTVMCCCSFICKWTQIMMLCRNVLRLLHLRVMSLTSQVVWWQNLTWSELLVHW